MGRSANLGCIHYARKEGAFERREAGREGKGGEEGHGLLAQSLAVSSAGMENVSLVVGSSGMVVSVNMYLYFRWCHFRNTAVNIILTTYYNHHNS